MKLIFSDPLHTSKVSLSPKEDKEVKSGFTADGLTVIVKVKGSPWQLSVLAVMLTVTFALTGIVPVLLVMKSGIFPFPLDPKPICLSQVHVKDEFGERLLKFIPLTGTLLQNVVSCIVLITGVGFTVRFTVSKVSHPNPFPVDNLKTYFTSLGLSVILFNVSFILAPSWLAAELFIPST